jgi:hypothetical protein
VSFFDFLRPDSSSSVQCCYVVFQYEFFIALLEEYLPDKQTMKELLNFKFSHYLDNPEEEVRLQLFCGF